MKRKLEIAALLLCLCCSRAGAASLDIKAAHPDLRAHVEQIFQENHERLQQLSGVDPPLIIIEIPPDLSAYQRRLSQIGAPRWAAGVAFANQVILRSPRFSGSSQNFVQVLLHELTHVYMNQALNGYPPPWWLQEGLAMLVARQNPGPLAMASALFNHSLLPWASMGAGFFPQTSQVDLAYAQAFYITAFLDNHGLLQAVIAGLGQGLDLNHSLHAASQQPLTYWEKLFEEEMSTRFSWLALGTGSAFWAFIGLAAAVIVIWRRRRMLRQMRAMDEPALTGRLSVRPIARPCRPRRIKTIIIKKRPGHLR